MIYLNNTALDEEVTKFIYAVKQICEAKKA